LRGGGEEEDGGLGLRETADEEDELSEIQGKDERGNSQGTETRLGGPSLSESTGFSSLSFFF
jgi:hypothetical protein